LTVILEDGIRLTYADAISEEEAMEQVKQERALWEQQGKKISSIDISLHDDELQIKTTELSPIKRYRRITGYVVPLTAMAEHKISETKERYKHMAR